MTEEGMFRPSGADVHADTWVGAVYYRQQATTVERVDKVYVQNLLARSFTFSGAHTTWHVVYTRY